MSRRHAALRRRDWQLARLRAFERDGWRCRRCGRAGRLEAHHLVALEDGGDPYDVDNVETRCRECHVAEHRRPESAAQCAWREFVGELR